MFLRHKVETTVNYLEIILILTGGTIATITQEMTLGPPGIQIILYVTITSCSCTILNN